MRATKWSKSEREVARRAFTAAYERECKAIAMTAQEMLRSCAAPEDIWKVEDYLSEARKQADFKYAYRYSMLIIVFGQLLKQKWLLEEDLSGLHDDKMVAIRSIAGRQ